jgi:hypothetical protein
MCAQLHFNTRKETALKTENTHGMTIYTNQCKGVMKVRLPNFRTNTANQQNHS